MNKYIYFLVIFAFSFLLSKETLSQIDYQSVRKQLVTGNLRSPLDTVIAPLWVGEQRVIISNDTPHIYICISKTAPKKWELTKSFSTGSLGSIVSSFGLTGDGLTGTPVKIDTTSSDLKDWILSLGGEVYPIRVGDSIHLTNGVDTSSGVFSPTAGGGTPGGTDTQVQFNDGGVFGGDVGFTYNKTTNKLNVDSLNSGLIRTAKFFLGSTNSPWGYNFHVKDTASFQWLRVYDSSAAIVTPLEALSQPLLGVKRNSVSASDIVAGFYDGANAILFRVAADGTISGKNVALWNSTEIRHGGTSLHIRPSNIGSTVGIMTRLGALTGHTASSGTIQLVAASSTFIPTSGTAQFVMYDANSTINQTGTASGSIFGFRYNPTATSILGVEYPFYTTRGIARFNIVSIGSDTPPASAALAISSTTQGFLPPVMTSTQAGAISSPAEGLLIYVTDTNGTFTSKGWWGYNGAAWEKLNN